MNPRSDESWKIERELGEALCRSLLYEVLSIGFRPPGERWHARLGPGAAVEALAEAAAVLDADRGTGLENGMRTLAAGAARSRLEEVRAAHRRIFGHTSRGPVPPYETEYGEDTLFQKPQEMSDIAGFLRAFGLVLNPREHERIDHIASELEFLAFLARKEAHALESRDDGMLEETRKATRLFLKDHLGRFAPSFGFRVIREDPSGFYGNLAALCLAFVRAECTRLQTPFGPETLRLRVPIDDGAPMACGVTADCVPGPCGIGEPRPSALAESDR